MTRTEIMKEATKYLNARRFLQELHGYEGILLPDDYKQLKQQALAGDIQGAEIRLAKLSWNLDRE